MADPYRILITGSRNWRDRDAVWRALSMALAQVRGSSAVIVHGGCKTGADAHAHAFCEAHPLYGGSVYVAEEIHRAAWKAHGLAAGPWRNRRMVTAGASLCAAFLLPCTKAGCTTAGPHDSHGASHCARLAEKASIPTRRITSDG